MRLNRFIARSGRASRRGADDLIKSGLVFVNGVETTKLATDVKPGKDRVEVEGKEARLPVLRYYALSKPRGYTTTRHDAHAEKTVFDFLPKDTSLFAVGRLDRDTEGLLLITNDGDFAQNIIHPSKKIEKEYEVTLKNEAGNSEIKKLESKMTLDDGPTKAKSVRKVSKDKLILVIEEGRKRIVRRMIKKAGNDVLTLKRVRIGSIKLDIKTGTYRTLTRKEISEYA